MQIPNSIIHIHTINDLGYGPIIAPEYEADVLRRVYQGRLNQERGGVTVAPYPENGNTDTRYYEAYSADAEMSRLRAKYKNNSQGFYVDLCFTVDEMSKRMEKLILDEADRLERTSRVKANTAPHKSYLDFGVTETQALSLQAAGFPNRDACRGKSILEINNVAGVDVTLAKRLIADDKPEKVK